MPPYCAAAHAGWIPTAFPGFWSTGSVLRPPEAPGIPPQGVRESDVRASTQTIAAPPAYTRETRNLPDVRRTRYKAPYTESQGGADAPSSQQAASRDRRTGCSAVGGPGRCRSDRRRTVGRRGRGKARVSDERSSSAEGRIAPLRHPTTRTRAPEELASCSAHRAAVDSFDTASEPRAQCSMRDRRQLLDTDLMMQDLAPRPLPRAAFADARESSVGIGARAQSRLVLPPDRPPASA